MAESRVEVAVVGLGAAGSAALWRLAQRGVSCAGFERFEPGHALGSSQGDSRIFRTAYFESPAYVPLLQAALPLWRELEAQAGETLLTLTGGLMLGRPDSAVVAGALRSAREHGLEHEVLEAADVQRRFPQHVVDPAEIALFEKPAGFLRPERAVAAAARRAGELGAAVHPRTRVRAVAPSGGGVRVDTDAGTWLAERALLCAGAWTPGLWPGLPLTVERVVQAWWPVARPADFGPDRFPVFIHHTGGGVACYGIPSTDGATIKVAGHGGGSPADPDRLDREPRPADWERNAAFVRERLRGVEAEPALARVCMYANTPDEHFLIAPLPDAPEIVVVSACSGHGFKFMPVLGEVAVQLALDGSTRFDLGPFGFREAARLG